jgi:hypothetical protein
MMRFWKRRDENQVDRLLRENRPAPRDEFISTILARVAPPGSRLRRGTPLRRVALATFITALTAILAGLMGGIQGAAAGAGGLAHVAAQTVSPSHSSSNESGKKGDENGQNGQKGNDGDGDDDGDHDADHHQYKVTICHWANHKYVTITVSQQGAAEHKAHHPLDIVPAPPGGCPR